MIYNHDALKNAGQLLMDARVALTFYREWMDAHSKGTHTTYPHGCDTERRLRATIDRAITPDRDTMKPDLSRLFVCSDCHGVRVEVEIWADANTLAYSSDGGSDEGWCNDCAKHPTFCEVDATGWCHACNRHVSECVAESARFRAGFSEAFRDANL